MSRRFANFFMNFLLIVARLALGVLKVIKIDVFGIPLRCHIRSSVEIMVCFEKKMHIRFSACDKIY